MTRDPTVFLKHIALCLDRIDDYVSDGRSAFMADTKTQDAVIRNLETSARRSRIMTLEPSPQPHLKSPGSRLPRFAMYLPTNIWGWICACYGISSNSSCPGFAKQ